MKLYIRESNEKKALIGDNITIDTINFFDFKNILPKDIIRYSIDNDAFLNLNCKNDAVLNAIYEYVICKMMDKELMKILNKNSIQIGLIMGNVCNYRIKYRQLLGSKIDEIRIECTKNNFIKGLVYAKMHNFSNIYLIGNNISLAEYYELLEGINFKMYDHLGIKVIIDESKEPISLSNLYYTVCKVKEDADKINRLNLSPMEKVTYAYDLIKERIYKENEKNKRFSRDINRILEGEYIVCVGYSRLFNALLSFLDIDSVIIVSDKKKHARNLVYVKDKKYNIDGFLVFDTTLDSKRNFADKDYMDRYHNFALPFEAAKNEYPIEKIERISTSFTDFVYYVMNGTTSSREVNTFMRLLDMMGIKDIDLNLSSIDNIRKLEKTYKLLMDKLYNTEISLESFVGILYNTRRGEYINGDIDVIDKDKMRMSTLDRNDSINRLKLGEMNHALEELFIKPGRVANNSYLVTNGERVISSSLDRKVSTEEDILDLRLVKVLKKRLNDIQNKN